MIKEVRVSIIGHYLNGDACLGVFDLDTCEEVVEPIKINLESAIRLQAQLAAHIGGEARMRQVDKKRDILGRQTEGETP